MVFNITEPLTMAFKIENEALGKTVIDLDVFDVTKRVAGTPQTLAIADWIGMNDAITLTRYI